MKENSYREDFLEVLRSLGVSLRWIIIALVCGLIIGLAGVGFSNTMTWVTALRTSHPWIIFTLPLGGCIIVLIYKALQNEKDRGTNLILESVQSGEAVPLRMAPCIFFSTIITHLCGGSAGREGAALQLGGSIAAGIGRLLHMDEEDIRIITMCGMSACFAALFGTPMAAAVFSLEVVTVGVLHYSALLPCVVSSLTATMVAQLYGIHAEHFDIPGGIPVLGFKEVTLVSVLGVIAALISIIFCVTMHFASHKLTKALSNPYLRIIVSSIILIIFTLIVGDQRYNGAGVNYIEGFFREGKVFVFAFLLKIIFTAITLGGGFKGGEIVPTLYIGAALGTAFGMFTGLSPGLFTACGMAAVFCGVTNSPITALLLSFELFGFEGMPYYILVVAIADRISGYYSLYGSQKLMYAKANMEFVDRNAK